MVKGVIFRVGGKRKTKKKPDTITDNMFHKHLHSPCKPQRPPQTAAAPTPCIVNFYLY